MLLSIYNGILTTDTAMNLSEHHCTERVAWKHLILVSLVCYELHTRPLLVSLLSDFQNTGGAGINSS